MAKEIWTSAEVIEIFEVDESFLSDLEAEEIVCPVLQGDPPRKAFPSIEMEKLRLAKILVEEMGVNLEGVDVILRMRQCMVEMREQFDAILEDLARQMEKALRDRRRKDIGQF